MPNETVVLKFGSSVLRKCADLLTAVHEIYRWYRDGSRVIVVVSAIDDTTDMLLASARELAAGRLNVSAETGTAVARRPEKYATAELLATGERASAALMGIALDRAGIPARVVDPRDIQLAVAGAPLDSEPMRINVDRMHSLLTDSPVLIVPGFFGHDDAGRLHLLGRGGTDLTAVFLADALEATRCRLIKDVDGVYEFDPASPPTDINPPRAPRRLGALAYEDAITRAAQLIQPKAVQYLERRTRTAEVAALARSYASIIGPHASEYCPSTIRARTRVALMGLGTVGFGVYQRLTAMQSDFEIAAVLVRDRGKYESRGVSTRLLFTDVTSFAAYVFARLEDAVERVDVVIDALGGLQPSNHLVGSLLDAGISVITANKALVATTGPRFSMLAQRAPVAGRPPCEFLYSAAVGGSAPMIEAVRRAARAEGVPIKSISGILNGTCNFLLNRAAQGANFADALREARESGLAEADLGEDLSGRDTARKLRILVRHAFGRDVDPDRIDLEPVDLTTFPRAKEARAAGTVLRLVATAELLNQRLSARVSLEALYPSHALADVPGEWNRLVIEHANGTRSIVSGRGAGRWPTTEAVIGDLLEFRMRGAVN